MADIPGRIDAAMQARAQQEQQNQFMAFVQRYGINVQFPARVLAKQKDDNDSKNNSSNENNTPKNVKTDKDLINARLLENGILFENLQSLSQLQEGVAKAVDNLMRTQAFHSVQIELDKNHDNNGKNTNESDDEQQQQGQSESASAYTNTFNVILDEKNWYSLYIGGGIKHEGMEEAMNSTTKLPKAQFESSLTLSNLTGYLDRSFFQYTVDQAANARVMLSHERPFYTWFPENSGAAHAILGLGKGSQYSLGLRALIDTADFESSRSYQEYQRTIGCRLDNTGNVGRSDMAPVTEPGAIYWGLDWTLGLRDIVPRKHPEIPYAADASPEIVVQSGPSLLHSLKWEARTNGSGVDDRHQPTIGVDSHASMELAGPPGDVGFLKAQGGVAVHVPLDGDVDEFGNFAPSQNPSLLDRISFHAAASGGLLKPLSFGGLCKAPTISDRFFVGGPMQLRGFLPAGIGPRSAKGGSTSPGGDAMGGSLYYTTTFSASMAPPPNSLMDSYGIRFFGFWNAGTLVGLSPLTCSNYHQYKLPSIPTWTQIAQSTRTAVGVGVSGGTPLGRMEVTYAYPLRYGPRDARRNLQFGFGFSFG
mmetsp:Transcript_26855/g.58934  ORF Transcript_26855/g.58934 Transcript_26855/m.58934 type:complete len:590 (-) Transcript_26855:73-1842(-)|eukprot:CAMPEP_0168192982 /NCGR_PEP_ID=MMETSP0139_2-20121125/18345_1 /TAXON_ID=44445 /ORGANISM="Pseudo-nitzschia australis, Strain 10249 10 AB" /LENGTH=589 /DNA_ID=CAMNT_0008116271 /DNA_START=126 /DNA_END=1895 /DNA_ORIENTATION=-